MFGSYFTSTAYRRPITSIRVRHGNRNRAWMDKNNYDEDSNDYDNYKGYLLFKSKFSNIPIYLQDVKEAYECCSGIKNPDLKCSCYQQFGVDGKMAEKYYKKMEKMEETYYHNVKVENEEDNKKEKDKEKKQTKQIKQTRQFYKWFNFGFKAEKGYDDEEEY
jgi:hypothetical protein